MPQTFGQAIASIVNHAMEIGTPVPEIIVSLDMLSFELKQQLLEDAKARIDAKPLIVPAQPGDVG